MSQGWVPYPPCTTKGWFQKPMPVELTSLLALRHKLVTEGHSYPKCVGKLQFSRYVLPYMHSEGLKHTRPHRHAHTSTQARTHGSSKTQSKRRKVNFCSLALSSQDHQHKQCTVTHRL